LISKQAYDQPLFMFQGILNPAPDDLKSPRVGVDWIDPMGLRDDVPDPPEGAAYEGWGQSYTYSFYAEPPAAAIHDIPDFSGHVAGRLAFGEVVLYDDVTGDGTFQVTPLSDQSQIVPDDVYRGAQGQFVIIYIDRTWDKETEPPPDLHNLVLGAPGYHLGIIDCSMQDVVATWIVNGGDPNVGLGVLPTASSVIPYQRSCLRSHPVAAPDDGYGAPPS
jgi:hypothetical protein